MDKLIASPQRIQQDNNTRIVHIVEYSLESDCTNRQAVLCSAVVAAVGRIAENVVLESYLTNRPDVGNFCQSIWLRISTCRYWKGSLTCWCFVLGVGVGVGVGRHQRRLGTSAA